MNSAQPATARDAPDLVRALPAVVYLEHHKGFRHDVLQQLASRKTGAKHFLWVHHKLVLLPIATLTIFGLLISGSLHGAHLVITEASLIVVCLISALGIAHDASHSAVSRRSWLNRLGTFVFDLVGVNGYIWNFDHVTAHHNTPNVSRYDANLYGWGPIRLDPHSTWRPYHRYQHLYAPFIYLTASLFKVYLGDFLAFARHRVDAYLPRRHNAAAWVRLAVFKAWSIAFTLVLPLWVNGQWQWVLSGYLLGHAINGMLMGAVFQPTHTNEFVTWPQPNKDGTLPTSFDEHVLATAADFAVDSTWITWLAGGLNIHAVHHLFPRVPQLDLPNAAGQVLETSKRHGLQYRTFPTWRAALASHYRALKKLGAAPTVNAPL